MSGRRTGVAALVAALVLAVLAAATGQRASAAADADATTVTMVQDWPTPWVGWIPWLVADAKGYFGQEGIKLEIRQPPTAADPTKFVSTGRADVAFTTALDVILARQQNAPVQAVGAYTQYNNWGLIFRQGAKTSLAGLKGKKIGIYPDAWTKVQLTLMLKSAGLGIGDVTLVTTPNDTAPLLIAKRIDVATGITNAEMTEVQVTGKQKPSILLGKDHGVPNSYVQVIAANTGWLSKNPKLAAGFMRAVKRGTAYALAHPAEALAIFTKRYPKALPADYAKASWQNTLPLFKSADTKAHGLYWNNPKVWAGLIPVLRQQKLVTKQIDPSSVFTNRYLGAK
jgi:ABC-type nitrate/sulfonate/bicarbonate transport system substrate-binding protein